MLVFLLYPIENPAKTACLRQGSSEGNRSLLQPISRNADPAGLA